MTAVCSRNLLADAQYPLTAETLGNFTPLRDSYGQWPRFELAPRRRADNPLYLPGVLSRSAA